jgi:hypothetical protein
MVSSSPPLPAMAHAGVYQVVFDPRSFSISPEGQRAIEDVSSVITGSKKALTGAAQRRLACNNRRSLRGLHFPSVKTW